MNTCTKSTGFSERQLSRFNKIVLWQKTLKKHTQKQTGGHGKATGFNGASDVDVFGHVEHQFSSDVVRAVAGLGHPAGIPLHRHVVEGSRDSGLGEASVRGACYHHLSQVTGVCGHFCCYVGLAEVSWSKREIWLPSCQATARSAAPQTHSQSKDSPTEHSPREVFPAHGLGYQATSERNLLSTAWLSSDNQGEFSFQAHCLLSNRTLPSTLGNPFRHPSLIPAFPFPDPHNNLIPLHQREQRSTIIITAC